MVFGFDNKDKSSEYNGIFKNVQVKTSSIKFTEDEWKEFKKNIQKDVLENVEHKYLGKYRDIEARQLIRRQILQSVEKFKPGLDLEEKQKIIEKLTNEISGYGILEQFLDNEEITEILVERYEKITIEKGGELFDTDVAFDSEDDLSLVIERILMPLGRRLDWSSPTVNARLSDGSRISAIAPPVSPEGRQITIRKFKPNISLDQLIQFEAINEKIKEGLIKSVHGRLTIFVSGGTGSGKSTFLNALSEYINPKLSIITIEDPIELQFRHPHVRRWEAKPPNIEGTGEISMMHLVITALRSRPDIIIVGEVRGKEAYAMLRGVRTGHPGSMTTGHADTPKEAMEQLVSMVSSAGELTPELVPKYVAGAIDLIVQLNRMPDGSRKLTEIAEVIGEKDGEILTNTLVKFYPRFDGKKVCGEWKEISSDFRRKKVLEERGIYFESWL